MFIWHDESNQYINIWRLYRNGESLLTMTQSKDADAYTVEARMDYQNFGYTSNMAKDLEKAKAEAIVWYHNELMNRIQDHQKTIAKYCSLRDDILDWVLEEMKNHEHICNC